MLQGRRALSVVGEGEEALLAVRDVAARLGVCTATVYRLVGEGHLPHMRVLNAIRVAPRDLEAFIEAQRRNEQEQQNFDKIMAAMAGAGGQAGRK